ncbi:diguanylate cyclase domain-containing protein [Candidatus Clostridium radicumherbarum]|uniref:Diguanylate cyclase domain-containing protein n=1 Tax=Candidatus Clostridium radicumherbarum TaxID=3381662 RepID=A0ABW8TUZ2_9CLOT
MIGTMGKNIYEDPLTGLSNFFRFIETDANIMFSGNGSVIIFDMVSFEKVNSQYGRDIGDLFLINFSKILRNMLIGFEGALKFRTHGDEFTVILPNFTENEAEELAQIIREQYSNTMRDLNFQEADVHILVLKYSNNINSINEFYQMMFFKSFKEIEESNIKYYERKIVGNIVGNFSNRIKETLSLLNDAYSLALTDDISELPNQRAAKIYLKNLFLECSKSRRKFSILFIDGDNLKRYNQISYSAGNEMIKSLSAVIAESLRKNDRIFRWLTGDEFLVILEDVDCEDEEKLAERVRRTVEERTVNWTYPITVSIGVASFPKDGNSIDEVLSKAEKSIIIAKSTGKNKVIRWGFKVS